MTDAMPHKALDEYLKQATSPIIKQPVTKPKYRITGFYKETVFQETSIGEIPKEWKVVRLGQIVDVYDSKRVPLSERERANRKGPYPYCGANGIIDYIDGYIFDGEYLLLAEDGGYYGPFEKSAYIMNGKFWVNNHAHVLKAKDGIAINKFLMYMLNFLDLRPYLVGSTRMKLNQKDMKRITLPLPPLKEQWGIAEVLSTLDRAIGATERLIGRLERLKRGLMQELLTKGIGHKEFKETPLGKIPKDWQIVKLGDIATIKGRIGWHGLRDEDYLEKGDYCLVRGIDFEDGRIKWGKCVYISKKWYDKDPNIQLNVGDVLVTKDGTIGKVAFIDYLPKKATLGTGIFRIRVKDEWKKHIEPLFLYYIFESHYFRFFIESLKAGSTLSHLYQKDIIKFRFPLPSITEQHIIVNILNVISELIKLEKKRREKLERVKRGLMELLLTGRVRVRVERVS